MTKLQDDIQKAYQAAFAVETRPHRDLSEAEICDRLGRVKAEIAPLADEEKALVDELKVRGAKRYAGNFYEANVFKSEREVLLADKVRKYLHPNQLRHCLKTIHSLTCVVSARGRR